MLLECKNEHDASMSGGVPEKLRPCGQAGSIITIRLGGWEDTRRRNHLQRSQPYVFAELAPEVDRGRLSLPVLPNE